MPNGDERCKIKCRNVSFPFPLLLPQFSVSLLGRNFDDPRLLDDSGANIIKPFLFVTDRETIYLERSSLHQVKWASKAELSVFAI
jgi:hypothetical protein